MTIADFLRGLRVKKVSGPLAKEVKGIAYDSRQVKKDYLFVAIRGFSTDGHTYIGDAVSRGCAGVIAEKIGGVQDDIAQIEVHDSREALALLSASFYREPSARLSLIGITGTNGKTTTSFITKAILETWGKKVGLIGTIRYMVGERVLAAPHTTPESLDLQRYLWQMAEGGTEYAVIEVSSHALALQRIRGCSFRVAGFTNFSQDHLDFHRTMEEYFEAKSRLFQHVRSDGAAVLNWDDPHLRSLAGSLQCKVITFGFGEGALFRVGKVEDVRKPGLSFEVKTPEGTIDVTSSLAGRNNIYNILMAISIVSDLGIDRQTITEGVSAVRGVEGRFERVEAGQDYLCIVDYAHTEDALRSLIWETRQITQGKVITVFGCGGDRDRTKRPKMGAAAAELSDLVIVTSDNPRTEDPMQIIKEVVSGMAKGTYRVVPCRETAIREAVSVARKGDTVLIAGKGHEDYQEINGVRYPFSDREALKRIIGEKMNTKTKRAPC